MAARSRFLSDHQAHEKKHDFAPARSSTNSWFRPLKALRRKRVILVLFAILLLYLFFKNIPTDVPAVGDRYDPRFGRLSQGLAGHGPESPKKEPPLKQEQSYEGPIKFYELAKTLGGLLHTPSPLGNVLFAVSKLDSIPRILPLACSMARHNRTRVHLAFMGRHSAKLDDMRALNGVSEADCDLHLHDARPDFAGQSSTNRLEVSARASLGHIHSAIRLHAVLVGDSGYEDEYLVNGLREKSRGLGLSLITLPKSGLSGMSWISLLDAQALRHVNTVNVDIIIQAQTEASANLVRLLRSIKAADYSGWTLPRLTIELPARIDPFLTQYLSEFQWPADGYASESRLVLRHRLNPTPISPVLAMLGTIESYYPAVPEESHVLILSPDSELSPGYFQYVMYTLLEYRYSTSHTDLVDHMIGISLDLPDHAPDKKTRSPWTALTIPDAMVLWQAPNSNAALYFGNSWLELHKFLAQRLTVDSEMVKKSPLSPVLSHDYPAWLHLMLEMMQARDYYMLYPTFAQRESRGIATLHGELHQTPEEYAIANGEKHGAPDEKPAELLSVQELTADAEITQLLKQEHRVYPESLVAQVLDLTALTQGKVIDVPMVSFYGEQMASTESSKEAWNFAQDFARSVGGCGLKGLERTLNNAASVDSLFCLATG